MYSIKAVTDFFLIEIDRHINSKRLVQINHPPIFDSKFTDFRNQMSYEPEFTPEGCDTSYSAVTVGAGVQWGEIYPFAEEHNITLVGGSDKTVGVIGGWLQVCSMI
jgi:hypothetical protein